MVRIDNLVLFFSFVLPFFLSTLVNIKHMIFSLKRLQIVYPPSVTIIIFPVGSFAMIAVALDAGVV